MTDPYRIGIAGLGTVGGGVIKIIQEHGELIERRAGRPVEIVSVCARSPDKDRGVNLGAYEWQDDPILMAEDSRLDAVVELIGGADGLARALVEKTLAAGKDYITANKALVAHHGY